MRLKTGKMFLGRRARRKKRSVGIIHGEVQEQRTLPLQLQQHYENISDGKEGERYGEGEA
jgi:hypothetical protein